MFDQELNYFIAHQEQLVQRFRGKVLALQGEQVLGAYDSVLQAYLETGKHHRPGTFMIQKCEPGPEAYTVTLTNNGCAPCL